jgi:hypothetical protein
MISHAVESCCSCQDSETCHLIILLKVSELIMYGRSHFFAEQCELNIDFYSYTCDVQYFDLCWEKIDFC